MHSDFVGACAVHDDGAAATQFFKDLSDGAAQLRVGNAHDLKLWARWGKDGAQRVEDRGYLQRAANGHDVRDRWVVRRCVEKGKAGFLELAHSTINVQIQWDVESF